MADYLYICDKCNEEITAGDDVDFVICPVCSNRINVKEIEWEQKPDQTEQKEKTSSGHTIKIIFLFGVLLLLFAIRTCNLVQRNRSLHEMREMRQLIHDQSH